MIFRVASMVCVGYRVVTSLDNVRKSFSMRFLSAGKMNETCENRAAISAFLSEW